MFLSRDKAVSVPYAFWRDRGWDLVEIEQLPVSKIDNCHISLRAAARFARTGEGSAGEGSPEGLSAL